MACEMLSNRKVDFDTTDVLVLLQSALYYLYEKVRVKGDKLPGAECPTTAKLCSSSSAVRSSGVN